MTPDSQGGKISVATLKEIESDPAWSAAFAGQRKDARYFQIVQQTLNQGFEHFYFVLDHPDGRRAFQPFFIHDQDVFAGSSRGVQSAAGWVRKIFPRFLKMRTLMVGCAAGEGRLDAADPAAADWMGRLLAAELKTQARRLRCGLVVMKEFHYQTRSALRPLLDAGFTRVPSLPMTRLNIDYPGFEQYMAQALSKATRKDLRRKFKASAAAPITLQVLPDLSDCVDEFYPLYLAVYERSDLHFEKLTPEFLCRLGRQMPDKVRYFLWRQNGRPIAFSLCMIQDDTIYDEYLGLDYSVALDLHLYFYTLRDILQWAMERGCKWYCSSALNYQPKLHLRCRLEPLDLYVSHTSRIINFFLARFLPWLEPTRNDPTLQRFANYAQLWEQA
jgi:Acetyltransferase (GNAT) domain